MKSYRILGIAVIGAFLMVGIPGLAHHAPQGEFDLHKRADLKGTVKRMEWISPHPSLLVDVKDASGKVTTWQFEADGIQTMRRGGVGRNLLKFGDVVTVTYWPAFNGSAHGFVEKLTMEDGRSYTVYFGEADRVTETTR
jgi:hypothetical protein